MRNAGNLCYNARMKEGRPDKLRMLVHVDMRYASAREIVGGILRFAAMRHEWEIQFEGGHPSNEPLEDYSTWRPDALVIDGGCRFLTAGKLSQIAGRAAVFVNTRPPKGWRRPCAVLSTDERALAAEAARFLRGKGLSHFAFVGAPGGRRWSDARQKSFAAALKDMGMELEVFEANPAMSWLEQENMLAEWLKSLPKPCGIWAAFDQRAKHVLDACRLAGIRVPSQVQVLGVDNETLICEQTVPSLSSLMPDFESGGFAAASFLDDILRGDRGRRTGDGGRATLHFAFKGVVERLSTADVNGTARRIAAAREFIRQHATSGIDVPHVASALGISVRLLQRDFRAVTGKTVLQRIQEEKLQHVKEMLRKTTTPIDNIGRFCGFKSPAHLKTLFKARFGMTMSAYRVSAEPPPKTF